MLYLSLAHLSPLPAPIQFLEGINSLAILPYLVFHISKVQCFYAEDGVKRPRFIPQLRFTCGVEVKFHQDRPFSLLLCFFFMRTKYLFCKYLRLNMYINLSFCVSQFDSWTQIYTQNSMRIGEIFGRDNELRAKSQETRFSIFFKPNYEPTVPPNFKLSKTGQKSISLYIRETTMMLFLVQKSHIGSDGLTSFHQLKFLAQIMHHLKLN